MDSLERLHELMVQNPGVREIWKEEQKSLRKKCIFQSRLARSQESRSLVWVECIFSSSWKIIVNHDLLIALVIYFDYTHRGERDAEVKSCSAIKELSCLWSHHHHYHWQSSHDLLNPFQQSKINHHSKCEPDASSRPSHVHLHVFHWRDRESRRW